MLLQYAIWYAKWVLTWRIFHIWFSVIECRTKCPVLMSAGHITFFIGQCPMSDSYFNPWKHTVFISFRKPIKTHHFPSKIGDFQHLPHFHSICEAPWMQILIFLQLMWCQECSWKVAEEKFNKKIIWSSWSSQNRFF